MKRWKEGEMSAERLVKAAGRRLRQGPRIASWLARGDGRSSRAYWKAQRDAHAGETAVVLANGPSLNAVDPALLRGRFVIGMNRIYLKEPDISPDVVVVSNPLVITEFVQDFLRLGKPLVVPWELRKALRGRRTDVPTLFYKTRLGIHDRFEGDMGRIQSTGGTVTFTCLQMAYHLGFRKVILLGLDHNFSFSGTPTVTRVRHEEKDENHFHPDYFPKGKKWDLPDLYRSELAYALARQAFERDGRRILDATEAGKCRIFERATVAEAFGLA